MPVRINKASQIWPCYSLARNLFKHTYFLLIISVLFIHFPHSEVSAKGQLGTCYKVFQYIGVGLMCFTAKFVEQCRNGICQSFSTEKGTFLLKTVQKFAAQEKLQAA